MPNTLPVEPRILSANTYFWTAAGNAGSRRRNERRRLDEVAEFFSEIGMSVERTDECVIGTLGELRAVFHYRESCKNVYKSLSITRAGRNSNITALRKLIGTYTPPAPAQREGGDDYYKSVAVTEDGRYVSIYDGATEYQLGVRLNGKARRDHQGGYYCYPTLSHAKHVSVPEESKAIDLPRVILRVKAEGNYCRYGAKLAFDKITPIEVVEA